jgi:RNA polymerase sigma-70 factor (ECF subfamily)
MSDSGSLLSDEQLALQAQNDVDVFGELIDRFEQPLMRYVRRISDFSAEEIEEVLQEVFLKAWRNLKDFDGSQKFSSWIYRITHNETISEFRRKKSRGAEKQIGWDEELIETLPNKIDLPKEFDQTESARAIRNAISKIPEKYRNAIVLRYLEEKTYDEMADILQMPVGSVATLVTRGKKLMRDHVLSPDL